MDDGDYALVVGYDRARGNVNFKLGFLGSLGSKGCFFFSSWVVVL